MASLDFRDFTDRARHVIDLANREAALLCHEYIGTEHLLLGLMSEGHGVAAVALTSLNQSLDSLRIGVRRIVHPGPLKTSLRQFPFTPRGKLAIELAREEARQLSHRHVGTEHLLLGLLRVDEGVAVQLLYDAHLQPSIVRKEVLGILACTDPTHE
jgi:ATP-dependent Clp protease ATP-binding subunit ClpC